MWALSVVVAALQARQAKLPPTYDGLGSRLLIMLLCYVQPLVRSWKRQRTRFFSYRRSARILPEGGTTPVPLPLFGSCSVAYWSQEGVERIHLLGLIIAQLNELRCGKTIDTGWESWDLELYCNPWTVLRIATAEEEHGGNKRLIRVRYQTRASRNVVLLWILAVMILLMSGWLGSVWMAASAVVFLLAGACGYWIGRRRVGAAIALVDAIASSLDLISLPPAKDSSATPPVTAGPEVFPGPGEA
jgi:hypothetical protein